MAERSSEEQTTRERSALDEPRHLRLRRIGKIAAGGAYLTLVTYGAIEVAYPWLVNLGVSSAEAAPSQTNTPKVEKPIAGKVDSPPLERFHTVIGGEVLRCFVDDQPYVVHKGDNIWTIVDAQHQPDPMPPRWVGTIVFNQGKGTVGDNPDLIHPLDKLFELKGCSLTPVAD